MARNPRKSHRTSNESEDRAGDFRRSRTVRFSDSEWQLVEDAALRQGIPASQLVRAATLAAAEERLYRPVEGAIPSGYLALIEATYRAVYLLATRERERILETANPTELDSLLDGAREAMTQTMNEDPE